MNNEVVAFMVILVGSVIATVVLMGLLIEVPAYLWDSNVACPAFGVAVERPTRYSIAAGGCFVQAPNGQWVRTNNYWNEKP